MKIRPAVIADSEAMWRIFQAVIATGTSWAFPPDTRREEALPYFMGPGIASWVAEAEDRIIGLCRVVPLRTLVSDRRDLGSHVANGSFMVDPDYRGHGAGKAMGLHCLREAKRAGYLAMQFNYVVSTNTPAVALWTKLGFNIVGTVPKAFRHKELGLVDIYVMHRFLDDIATD